ncbi:MAG: DUF1254 domain-containing protein [Mycobacterium sp.]
MDLSDLSTPSSVETLLGTLEFVNGTPTEASADVAYAALDRLHAVDAFIAGLPAVSQWAIRQGYADAGIHDHDVLLFSGLMDSASLFLTANADTVYFWTFLDLTDGPVAVQFPPEVLGVADDMWWRWITDFGIPGPDRGHGGTYVFVGPGYSGPLPEGGVFVAHSRTTRVSLLGRAFLDGDDPAPAVRRIHDQLRIGRYAPGAFGTSVASFLDGTAPMSQVVRLATPRFVEGTGLAVNTIYPSTSTFYELLDAAIQAEPASAMDPELAGPIAAIGIVKDQPFAPGAEMRAILDESAATANALVRTISMRPRKGEGFQFYPGTDSQWTSPLFAGGYAFQTPPPRITTSGVEPLPDHGAKLLNARASFFYLATGVTPAMCMNLPGIGSQYIGATTDEHGDVLDGANTYTLTLPKDIPAEKFWSITLYDSQTRSMLVTDQRFPRAGSQAFPTPAATPNPDRSTELWFAPRRPEDVADGNWIQTASGHSWFALLRFYSPTPAFFDRSWQPTNIKPASRQS